MRRWLAMSGFVLGLSLIGYAVFARETDEEQILALVVRIEKAVRVDGDTATNPLIRGGQLRRSFSESFDKNVSYRIPELTSASNGVESLVALATRTGMTMTTLDVAFSGTEVQMGTPPTLATAKTVAKVRAFRGSERYEEGDRKVRFELSKSTGTWRVTSFDVGTIQD